MLPRLGSLVPGPTLPMTQRCRPSEKPSAASRASSPARLVDLEGAVGEVELAQRDRRGAERVGLHHVGAGLEVAAMDVAHEVGARQHQHVGAVLPAPVVLSRHPAAAPARGCPCRRRTAGRWSRSASSRWGRVMALRLSDHVFEQLRRRGVMHAAWRTRCARRADRGWSAASPGSSPASVSNWLHRGIGEARPAMRQLRDQIVARRAARGR